MRSHDDRGFEEVAAVLREDLARARLADLVPGPPDALQAARDRTRRLDEHDEIDRAHVDAELEARRRDDRAQPARLQLGLDLHPLLARQRPVVRAHEFFAREFVEVAGEPFGHAARVAEHDRGAVRADEFEDARVHVRPDRRVLLRDCRTRARSLRRSRPSPCAPGSFMSSTGTITSTSSGLREPASTIVTGRGPSTVCPPRKRAISSSGRCVRRQARSVAAAFSVIASSRSSDSIRCAPRFVGASAWISSMMTVSTLRNVSRARDVSIRYSDSGVVMRMSGGVRTSFWRSLPGVSPVRIATVGASNAAPSRSAASVLPASGERRFFSTSNASARSGEM